MNPNTLLQTLEPLTHQARMRQMVEIGKQSRNNRQLASTLIQLAQGDFYQRYLALQACYGSGNIELIYQSLSDPSRKLRSLASRLIVLFGDNDQLIAGLQAIPTKQRSYFFKLLLKNRRYAVIERYLTDLAIANPEDFSKFLSFGSTEFVTHHIEVLLHRSSQDDWRRLARYHPTLTANTLQKQAEAITKFDRRLSYYVSAALPELAERCPTQALNLCRALLRTTSINQIDLPSSLVAKCWNEVAQIVLQSEDRADWDFHQVAHKLDWHLLLALIEKGYLKNPRLWLSKLEPGKRSQLYTAYCTRWRDENGVLAIDLIQLLSLSQREQEAHLHLNLPILATRLNQRLPYAAFLPWDAAWNTLKTFVQNPAPEIRIIALRALVETVRFQRRATSDLLQKIIVRRNEQDPIRGAILGAMASLPPGLWKTESLPDLTQIIKDALNAADLSYSTASSIERFVIQLLPFHPAWAAQQLALIVKVRGQLSFYNLGDRLSNSQVREVAPQLLPIFQAWADRERGGNIVTVAQCFGRRLRVFDGLVALVEQVIGLNCADWVASSGLQVLESYHYDRVLTLIPALIAQDRSWITHWVVQKYLHRHRQDLLTPFLERRAYKGRFSTGKTYLVLSISDGFHRWTANQQQKFSETLVAVTRDEEQNQPALFGVMDRLGALQNVAPTRLIQLAQLENSQLAVRDRALRVLARRDNGDGIPVLLAAMEDDRARIAIYALRTSILAMSPQKAIALLQTIPDTKVTVAKEVIRLIGEFTTESAYQELLAWHKKELHRDVRVALLRAFWTHLERDETWTIFQQAAVSTDSAISTMVTRIPSNSLSIPAQAKLLAILATLLQHPDPLVRIDVLRRCVSLPIADPLRQLQQPLIQRLTSSFPDESLTAAQAFFATYRGDDGEVVVTTIQKILPDRRSLKTTIDALQRELKWRRSQLLPIIRMVLAVLATDPLVSSLRWKLAIAAMPPAEFTEFAKSSIQTLLPETLWYVVLAITKLTSHYELNDLITLETALLDREDARLRQVALAALKAQIQIDGWNKSRRLRLVQYQNDPVAFVAAAAQFIFPPLEIAD